MTTPSHRTGYANGCDGTGWMPHPAGPAELAAAEDRDARAKAEQAKHRRTSARNRRRAAQQMGARRQQAGG
jgi:hypothetical protein